MTVDEVADELYGLDPSDFVAARTVRQKQARAEGDRDLATRIGALRKPTLVGWALNRVVRGAGDELGDLLDLGQALREAQQHLSGPALRTLTRQRQMAVRALADRAADIAAEHGRPLGEDARRAVVSSLNAALSDADIATDILRGRMLDAVEYSGFGPMGLVAVPDAVTHPEHSDAVQDPAQDNTTPQPAEDSARDDTADRQREEAEQRARAERERDRQRARVELENAETALGEATESERRAADRVTELAAAVRQVERELVDKQAELENALAAHGDAEADVVATSARVRNATTRLDRM